MSAQQAITDEIPTDILPSSEEILRFRTLFLLRKHKKYLHLPKNIDSRAVAALRTRAKRETRAAQTAIHIFPAPLIPATFVPVIHTPMLPN